MNKQKLEEIGDEFVGLLKEYAVESGKELTNDLKEVRDYVASRMPHIAAAVGEKGFAEALKAERDNIALVAAGRAIDRGDAFDARILGLAEGVVLVASKALVALA